jgi:hypothetical protein
LPLGAALLLLPTTARAMPKYNPFTYTYATLGEGEMEIEQYVDFVPLKATALTGAPQWYLAPQFQTEFEYGITDRLELGLYVTYAPAPSPTLYRAAPYVIEGNGAKQRLRLRLAEPDEWPIDVGLYAEVVENDREIEIEAKIILEKRIDRLRAIVNLWGEREYYFDGRKEWVINPTVGLSYQVTPSIFPGVEGWVRAEWPDGSSRPRVFNQGPAGYAGPTLSINFGRAWWTVGAYLRFTDPGHTLAPGEVYGNFWARSIVGFDL